MLCKCELLCYTEFYAGCYYGGSYGVVGVCVFHPLSLCLEVYLLSTVCFGTHPLLLQFFCRLLARTFVIYSYLFPGFLEICEVVVGHLSIPLYTCLWFCSTLETISYETYVFFWSDCNTLEACTRDFQVLGFLLSYLYFTSALYCNGWVLGWLFLMG